MQTIRTLNKIGMALSAERDQERLLKLILSSARELTGADAGTLYIVDEEVSPPVLRFAQLQNASMNIFNSGVDTLAELGFKDIVLDHAEANVQWVVQHAIVNDEVVNIDDVYAVTKFDVSGTKAFDQSSGYRTKSMLVVPMRDHQNHVIGGLQLINKLESDQAIAFEADDEDIARSLASQGAVALTQQRLIDGMQALFNSFTRVIASAIDSKSPQTGAHCRRIPDVTLMFARAGCRSELPVVKDFSLNDDEMYELELAAWLHDCGKIITPHHVVEKSTKLETLYDGIELVAARLEVVQRDLEIAALRRGEEPEPVCIEPEIPVADTLRFLRTLNRGSEFVTDAALDRLAGLAELSYTNCEGNETPLLDTQMRDNLAIRRGTLNSQERQIMQDHMKHTLAMLSQLPFPKHLQRVPEYAGGHHEKMNGQGYPLGLTREEMSIPARMMGIADVFEALTAPERSYKDAMSLSQALTIMGRMVEEQHLDAELFQLFIDEKVYLEYAELHLNPEQIDNIDPKQLPGYPA